MSRSRSRAGFAGLLAVALPAALLVLTPTPAAVAAPTARGAGLDKHDRELLAEARADGDKTVTLLIASKPGANKTVVSGLTGLGGTVQKRDDDVSYLRASVPIGKAEAAARRQRRPGRGPRRGHPARRPGAARRSGPDAADAAGRGHARGQPLHADRGHRRRRSSWRPTRPGTAAASPIGIVDTGVDLDHPACTTTSTGERKIVDWVTDTDPFDRRRPDLGRHDGRRSAARRSPSSGVTYTAPAGGSATASASSTSATPPRRRGRQRRQPRRQPRRQQRHLRRALEHRDQQRLGRHQPEPHLRRRDGDDRLQGPLRRQLLRHRQPGDRRRRADAVRRADRRQEQGRQHRHRLRRSTARTSRASSPATASSAAR